MFETATLVTLTSVGCLYLSSFFDCTRAVGKHVAYEVEFVKVIKHSSLASVQRLTIAIAVTLHHLVVCN